MLGHIHALVEALQKTVTVKRAWVQARRVRCEICNDTFVYIASEPAQGSAKGMRLFTNDADLQRDAEAMLQRNIDAAAKKRRVGEATCPHCGRLQPWMVRRSYGGVVLLLVAGVAIGAAVGLAVASLEVRGPELEPLIVGGVVGSWPGLLGFLWKSTRSLPRPDPRSMDDASFAALSKSVRSPIRAWYFESHKAKGFDPVLVPFLDLVPRE